MNVNELRIGNWVNYKNEPFKVKGVVLKNIIDDDREDCVYEDTYAGYPIDEINPIPLTTKILEDAGFQRMNPYPVYSNGKIGFSFLDSTQEFEYLHHGCKGKFVHQLQNLYFALTGEELMIEDLSLATTAK